MCYIIDGKDTTSGKKEKQQIKTAIYKHRN